MSCFQGLFFCPEAVSLLLHNFCVYHITPQGHEVSYDDSFSIDHVANHFAHDSSDSYMAYVQVLQLGAAPIPPDVPVPSVDDLTDQIADVLDFFKYTMNKIFNCLRSERLHYQRSSRTLCVQVREVLSIDLVGKF
jgi:hypothetical protein